MPYKDPQSHKEAKARWYQKNKQLTKDRALDSKHRTQDWFKEDKLKDANNGCLYCGYVGDPIEFDYHHRDPSTKICSISDMVGRYSRKTITEEKKKCDFICKECHKDIHKNYPFQ
tara:strand:- start:257 stop:601 length:345 start_codon:yes stop_codon:yes gene_type:complete